MVLDHHWTKQNKMVDLHEFMETIKQVLQVRISPTANRGQYEAITAPKNESLFIVAGPGSGKTTVITLKVLKLILVDDVKPEEIIVTTFTRKAAAELLNRIVYWGEKLSVAFGIREVGFNLINVGTTDSIISELMKNYKTPGESQLHVIQEFVAKGIMLRKVLVGGQNRNRRKKIEEYYKKLSQHHKFSISDICSFLNTFKDKILYDMVDIDKFKANNHDHDEYARETLMAVELYMDEMKNRKFLDFSLLATNFLNKLQEGLVDDFLKSIKFLLIDEYQDSNYLQEQIYFKLAESAVANGGSITVVGDDDQSLYRFRGATVELFIDFPKRIEEQIGVRPKTVYLSYNFRSTLNIVKFVNKFVSLDEKYMHIRAGNKPVMYPARCREYYNYPVLGMFRDSLQELAKDLAQFIYQALNSGYKFEHKKEEYLIKAQSVSDIVFLSSSPKEEMYVPRNDGSFVNVPRLPKLLREELEKKGIKGFNPRGRNIEKVEVVRLLCGLILECIDPGAEVQKSMKIEKQISSTLDSWRREAIEFVNNHNSDELKEFFNAWRDRRPLNRSTDPEMSYKVPIAELAYSFARWLPELQEDPENLAYFELIQRVVDGSKTYNLYNSEIVFKIGSKKESEGSVRDAIWAIFVPIASGGIDVDEELTEMIQASMLNIMSIHQSKGLEFPIVIVDVGSDASKELEYRFFPVEVKGKVKRNTSINIEEELAPYSKAGCYGNRRALYRAFDDLIRLYFVAYSRAQDVLMLVGLNDLLNESNLIKNVALGWSRDERWQRELLNSICFI